jgi:hypothetical protein
MIGTIRKHSTWLWLVIIVAVIVSFVIYFTPTVGSGGGPTGATEFGTINDRPITRKEYKEALTDAQLRLFLRTGQWPDSFDLRRMGVSLEDQTRDRLVLLDQVRRNQIKVDDAAVARWIAEQLGDPSRPGSARQFYENLVNTLLPRHGVYDADFVRFIRNEIAVNHLLNFAGQAGRLVPPREAEAEFRRSHDKIEADAVVFSASNHLAAVVLDPPLLGEYYTNNRSLYRIDERVRVHYIEFLTTNFVAQADEFLAKRTNLTEEIDREYIQRGASSFVDTNGQVMPPDLAKARLRSDLRDRQAAIEARKAASAFAANLESLNPPTAEGFVRLAAEKGVLPLVTEPFTRNQTPPGLRVGRNFTEIAFKLDPTNPISSTIVGQDGVYVIALKERLPSVVPELEQILERVTEDYKRDTSTRLAREAGERFVRTLTNGLAQGKDFAAICVEAGVTPVTLPVFTAATRTPPPNWDRRLNLEQVKAMTANKAAGTATDLIFTRDGGFVVYVKARTPVTDEEVKAGLAETRQELERGGQSRAYNDWFLHQLQASRINTIKGRDESADGSAQP